MKPNSVLYNIALILIATVTAGASAKTVYCISTSDDPDDQQYLYDMEGWARERAEDGDVISIGGNLEDCVAQLEPGDTLIIIAHGTRQEGGGQEGRGFEWNDEEVRGFGDGPNQVPLPPELAELPDITIIIWACWSANDPDGTGDDTSMVEKMNEAAGGRDVTSGSVGEVEIRPRVSWTYPAGLPQEQEAAYDQAVSNCLAAANPSIESYPPANRPGANPNQQTAAQDAIDNCESWPDQFPRPTVTVTYPNNPTDLGGGNAPYTDGVPVDYETCGLTHLELVGYPPLPVPAADFILIIAAAAAILLAAGTLKRRQHSTA